MEPRLLYVRPTPTATAVGVHTAVGPVPQTRTAQPAGAVLVCAELVCAACVPVEHGFRFQGLQVRPMKPGRKQRDLSKDMGNRGALSISHFLAKL